MEPDITQPTWAGSCVNVNMRRGGPVAQSARYVTTHTGTQSNIRSFIITLSTRWCVMSLVPWFLHNNAVWPTGAPGFKERWTFILQILFLANRKACVQFAFQNGSFWSKVVHVAKCELCDRSLNAGAPVGWKLSGKLSGQPEPRRSRNGTGVQETVTRGVCFAIMHVYCVYICARCLC